MIGTIGVKVEAWGAEVFVQMLFGARGAAVILRPVDVARRAWR